MIVADKISIARFAIKDRTPYFTAVVRALVPLSTPGLGTIGVTARGVLMYDPEFIAGSRDAKGALDGRVKPLTDEELTGILVHEVLHVVGKHFTRMRGPAWDSQLVNVAQDLSINDQVVAMGYRLTAGALFPAKFKLPPNLTGEEYYRLLEGRGKPPPPGKCPGEGACGSCTGPSLPGEPQEDDEVNRTPTELDRVIMVTAEQVRQAATNNPGSVPAGLLVWANQALAPPRVRWQDKLARYARARIAAAVAGSADYSYARPARRTAWNDDAPVMPHLVGSPPRVALVIDTSGSMLGGELGVAVAEARGVLAACGAGVSLVAADAAVHGGVQRVKSIKDLLSKLKGGGGTDFRPAYDALLRERPRPDVVIYATDGYGPAPEHEPIPTIWLLIGKSPPRPAAWGTCVEVD